MTHELLIVFVAVPLMLAGWYWIHRIVRDIEES
jgi:hypothetical protein